MKKSMFKNHVFSMFSAVAILVAAPFSGCETASEADFDEDEAIEAMNEAYAELMATEGKADGATCSGVRPPDNGPFDKRIALTFDDGPNLSQTPRVLEVLRAHNAKATFFVNGNQLRSDAQRELLREMLADGHIVGNHSQNHPNSVQVSSSRWREEVRETHELIKPILAEFGQTPKYFRFPFGSANCSTYSTVTDFGYHVVGWHIDTADWCFQNATGGRGYCDPRTFRWIPDSYRNNYLGFTLYQARRNGGGILLMHDIHSYTVENLDRMLTQLRNEGFTFTNLDDVNTFPNLNGHQPPRDPWVGDPCLHHDECYFSSGSVEAFCHTFIDDITEELNGFCSLPCDGYCPDMQGTAPTFCIPSGDPTTGICVSRAWPSNESCAQIPGTSPQYKDRFVYESNAPDSTQLVCAPD